MTVAALFSSHTPLMGLNPAPPEAEAQVNAGFEGLGDWVAAFNPDLVIEFAPDHFNGFFYGLMPSFCVGAAAHSIGDFDTQEGDLPVDAARAEALVSHLHASGIDAALSYRMEVDHGVTQVLEKVFAGGTVPPLVPIFVNCIAPPRPPLERVRRLGEAVGVFASSLDCNVLIIGSGGLSHDPPVPLLKTAPPEVRERMIAGGPLPPDARAKRQDGVLKAGRDMAAGTSDLRPLNPVWDQVFLDNLVAGDLDAATAMGDDGITRDAGRAGHEIRTWVAGCAAMSAIGPYQAEVRMYRDIPEWIAGFGMMTVKVL